MFKKGLSSILALLIVLSFLSVLPVSISAVEVDTVDISADCVLASTGATQADYVSWITDRGDEGWWEDVDGVYGCQCVDLVKAYYRYFGYGTDYRGYAYDYQWDHEPTGSNWYYSDTPIPGSVFVQSAADAGFSTGHVGLVYAVDDTYVYTVETNIVPSSNGYAGERGYANAKYSKKYRSRVTIYINPTYDNPNPDPTPDFTPVDVGTDFYANICNIPTYKRVAVAGTNVELKSANGDDSQKWKFERLDDTLYKITNVATGMCMEVSNFGTEDRTNIQVMPWADNDAQKWYFKIVRDGCYSLVPKCAVNSCIDTYGYFDDNTNIQLYRQNATDAQTFALNIQPAFEARNIGNSFVASIIHPSSDMAVTYDLSWNVIINPHSNAKSQQWLFEIMDDRSYKITNLASNMCLDVSNFGTANGTNIQLMPSADNIAQRWFIKAVGNGYSLVPKCACESAIDIDGVIKDGGNNIQLFRQNSYLNQIFSIRRVIDDNMVSVSDVVLNNNSEAVNPQISVKVDNTILKADSDYSVTIEADTTQEKGTVTITGINNYCGNVTKSFSITVIAQTEPTTPPTTPPTEPSIIKLGDVDGDDEVTIIDATCIQRKLASIATAKFVEAAADTDEDGEITIIDATVIQRWLAQLPTNENIGKPSIT